ncbi:isoprenylcysteine carboxylmethyltransferase family protein [Balneolales bacterium ANBcel1]|nr:isoprenylcysteine carboxylmethyltransferase family protein [Balneolales bacterium ANBcel1]
MNPDSSNENEDSRENTASVPAEHPLERKIPPVVVFGFFALAMWAIARYFPVFAVDIPFQYYLTAFLMGTAILTAAYSIYLFMKNQTTVHAGKPAETTALVTDGPYRHSRNPMYLSLSLVLIGWAIFLSDLLCLMLMPLFYIYMTRFQIISEERALREKFGEDYDAYTDRTPRWL